VSLSHEYVGDYRNRHSNYLSYLSEYREGDVLRMKLGFLCLALVLLVPLVAAYPLSGSNGIVNATVLGTYNFGKDIRIDMMFINFPSTGSTSISLVDSDDNFYEGSSVSTVGIHDFFNTDTGRNAGSAPDGSRGSRHIYSFSGIPQDAEIKRIRITPPGSDPFAIEWQGIPEAVGTPLSMKFYGIESNEYSWLAKVKLMNTGTNLLKIKGGSSEDSGFYLGDQFGFYYAGLVSPATDLLPGESIRVTIDFRGISKLSRPVELIYAPSGLKLEISAWA
jgi:hypothetical protein